MTSFRPPARIDLYVDNMAAISLETRNKDAAGSWRTRHLKVRSSYVRENVVSGELRLEYVPGSIQLADILTKAVPAQRHKEISFLLGHGGRSNQLSEGKKSLPHRDVRLLLYSGRHQGGCEPGPGHLHSWAWRR